MLFEYDCGIDETNPLDVVTSGSNSSKLAKSLAEMLRPIRSPERLDCRLEFKKKIESFFDLSRAHPSINHCFYLETSGLRPEYDEIASKESCVERQASGSPGMQSNHPG
jgi:hypothetical protein